MGLELMALCTYVLTGFLRQQRRSNEAALKYVILGAVSTAISFTAFPWSTGSPARRSWTGWLRR